ncbi:MAG TPA: hypothetical protein DCP47_03025 [Phycisphaerales bacterium]|nr:hypothetical protein [Phycisphaerales bacterium]
MVVEGVHFNKCPIILLFWVVILSNSMLFGQISILENGSNVAALHFMGLTGAGVNVGLISGRNVYSSHLAFNDSSGVHVINSDYSGSGINYDGGSVPGHDTWVAGIIGSRGWIGYTTAIGTAPGCNIYSARVVADNNTITLGDFELAFNALISSNCKVFVLPLQLGGTANGDSVYSKMVDYYAYTNNLIIALASGNDYSYPTIFGDAYNGITTGALIDETSGYYDKVGTKSNPGPTVDGRNKPDICAPGSSQVTPHITSTTAIYTTVKDGATSFSEPQTGGIATLLLQYANSTTEANDDKNIVIKAVIVNSTFPNIRDKAGAYTNPAVNTWNADRGYGRIDALRAYQTLSAGKISSDVSDSNQIGWAYSSLPQNGTHTYKLHGDANERLVATVTWNRKITKKPSGSYEEESPKFNIDLTIRDPDNVIVYSETDTLNNLIKVDLPLKVTGEYTIILKNTTNINNRYYALAFEFLEPLAGDFNFDFIVDRKDLAVLAGDWLKSQAGLITDIIPDANVNNLDYGEFAEKWMDIDKRYYTP